MLENAAKFTRFFAQPANIQEVAGSTVEELKMAAGQPDPNPVVQPMPELQASRVFLARANAGSDLYRVAGPDQPAQNPFEGPRSISSLNRSALAKLGGRSVDEVESYVKANSAALGDAGPLMDDSFARLHALCGKVGELFAMAELVTVKAASVAKA